MRWAVLPFGLERLGWSVPAWHLAAPIVGHAVMGLLAGFVVAVLGRFLIHADRHHRLDRSFWDLGLASYLLFMIPSMGLLDALAERWLTSPAFEFPILSTELVRVRFLLMIGTAIVLSSFIYYLSSGNRLKKFHKDAAPSVRFLTLTVATVTVILVATLVVRMLSGLGLALPVQLIILAAASSATGLGVLLTLFFRQIRRIWEVQRSPLLLRVP